MKEPRSLRALFSMPGFIANSQLKGVLGDRYARAITLRRRKKQRSARVVDNAAGAVTINASAGHEICPWQAFASSWNLNAGGSTARGVRACM